MTEKDLKVHEQKWNKDINDKIKEIISKDNLAEKRPEIRRLIYQKINLNGDSSVTLSTDTYNIEVHKKFEKDGKTQVTDQSFHHVSVYDKTNQKRIFTIHYNISADFPDGVEFY